MLIALFIHNANNVFMDRVKEMLNETLAAKGRTQADLARYLGVSPQTINNWKRRDSIPKAYAASVSRFLGVPMENVLGAQSNARDTRLRAMEWDSESELDETSFLLAPLLDVDFSAGDGRAVEDEREQYRLPIRRYTLKKQGIPASKVRLVRVFGDSMEDKIPDDSVVAINIDDTVPRDGKIFVYTDEDLLKVKYLHPLPGGGLRIRSHNPEYPDETLNAEQVSDRITIHGRVFMYSSMC